MDEDTVEFLEEEINQIDAQIEDLQSLRWTIIRKINRITKGEE